VKRSPLKRQTPLKRTAFKREPHQVPRKKPRRKDIPKAIRDAVWARSGGMCEGRVSIHCRSYAGPIHHRWMRSQGGPDTMENLLHLCTPCHIWVHHAGQEAYDRGFLLRAGSRPSAG
jgi:5-methylcytosine-specific restriction endonuclease McrA